MRFLRFCLLLPLLLAYPAYGQGSSDGSIYSRFGLGELRTFGSSQIQAMGGESTALPGVYYTNHSNPAAWGDLVLMRASIGVQYQGIVAEDGAAQTSRLTSGALNAVQFSFPLKSRKLGVGVSFEPFTRSNYRVQVRGLTEAPASPADTATYLIDYEGRGGLQQVVVGAGYRLSERFSVGAGVNFIFGLQEDVRSASFPYSSHLPSRLADQTRLAGATLTLGSQAGLTEILGENDVLSLGAVLRLPAKLHGSRVRTVGQSLDADTLGAPLDGSATIPFSFRLGFAYQPDARWALLADGRYETWSNFESDFAFDGYTPGGASNFNNRLRLSGGAEFLPGGRRLNQPFLSRVAYRLGGYYDQGYVSPRSGFDVNTVGLTAGLSLPSTFAGSRLDLNFEVGRRGSTENLLVRDTFYRISANVNIGERWFEKRRLR